MAEVGAIHRRMRNLTRGLLRTQKVDLWELNRAHYWELHWQDRGERHQLHYDEAKVPVVSLTRARAPVGREFVTSTTSAVSFGPAAVPLTVLTLERARTARIDELVNQLQKPGNYLLLISRDAEDEPYVVPIGDDAIRIGRSLAADVRVDDPAVSRRHAVVFRNDKAIVIADHGSLNGVYVNGDRVDGHVLKHKDEIVIGRIRFIFVENPPVPAA